MRHTDPTEFAVVVVADHQQPFHASVPHNLRADDGDADCLPDTGQWSRDRPEIRYRPQRRGGVFGRVTVADTRD